MKMKKYKVFIKAGEYYSAEVEANSPEEAMEFAKDIDESDMKMESIDPYFVEPYAAEEIKDEN